MTEKEQIVKLRTQLQNQEKLAEIGQLTAGILHEIRNPLNFVTNFSNLSLELIKEMEEIVGESKIQNDELLEVNELLKTNIETVKKHGERATRLITNMLASTHISAHEFEPARICEVTQEAVKLAYHGLRGNNSNFNAELTFDLEENLPDINIAFSDFNRTILNIAGNAFFALATKQETNSNFAPKFEVKLNKVGNDIVIKLKDNGIGMSEETMVKIFKPFFTTKSAQHGTGLGLSMSHQIITEVHKGNIEVLSNIGEFTEFIITFPANLKSKVEL